MGVDGGGRDAGVAQQDLHLCRSLVMSGWEQVKTDWWRLPRYCPTRPPLVLHIITAFPAVSRRQPEKYKQGNATPSFAIMLLTDGCRSASDRL